MFGPLPLLHRLVLVAITVCAGTIGGAWVAHYTALPVAVSAGALLGACVGLAGAWAVVRESHQPRPQRVVRRR